MNLLKKRLFDEYGGFADKRIKDLNKGQRFVADDREPRDFGSNKDLYSYFCKIFIEVLADTKIRIILSGNVPVNQHVRDWAANHQEKQTLDIRSHLSFVIEKGQESSINELADYIEAIVAPNAPSYDVPNYKYVCPRTADSLRRLSKVLSDYWNR